MNYQLFAVFLVGFAARLDRGLAAIGDRYAFERILPEPRVCIHDGCLQGKYFNGLDGDRYEGYLGVPFAKPPVGKLRFKNPVRNDPWDGDYDASEDCLYLNVFRPRNVTGPLPVIFFIHGGAFTAGSSSMGEFGPERFMDTGKVILVISQYRLGVFGFLSTEDRASPGNYGLKDQLFALRWTQRNIAHFSGDPNLVTIVGQSAGSSSVQYHMVSPQSKGLFARAVSMSGSALGSRYYSVDQLALARRQAGAVGISNASSLSTERLVDALREVDGLELAKSIDKLKYFYVHPILRWHPTIERYVDGETFISEDPREVWRSGRYHQVPYTMGFLPNDGAYTSAILLSNSSLLNELNEKSADYIPRLVAVNHPTSVRMLKNRFFPDGSNDRWLTEKNVGNLETLFVEYIVYIAYNGVAGLPCTADSCPLLEFTNSYDASRPVKLNLIDGFDEEKFAFWSNLYAVQNSVNT
ncbi:hypothetical protein quinque_007197 [Culex quinquefasciatus]